MKPTTLMKKFGIIFASYILFFFIIVSFVSALGVTPARHHIPHESLPYTGSFTILNDGTPRTITITSQGQLKPLLTFETNTITFARGETERTIHYTLNTPPIPLKPGENTAILLIQEQSHVSTTGGQSVTATLNIITTLVMHVPYPEEYATITNFYISSTDTGTLIPFTVQVRNLGNKDIQNAYTTITIYKENTPIDSFTSETALLERTKKQDFTLTRHLTLEPNTYTAEATLSYNNKKQSTTTTTFTLNAQKLIVKNLAFKQFLLGQVTPLTLTVENLVTYPLTNVHGKLFLYDHGKEILTTETPLINLKDLSKEELTFLVDTSTITKGTYQSTLILSYEDGKTIELTFDIAFTENDARILYRPSPTNTIYLSKTSTSLHTLFIILIFIFILFNIGWFLHYHNRHP